MKRAKNITIATLYVLSIPLGLGVGFGVVGMAKRSPRAGIAGGEIAPVTAAPERRPTPAPEANPLTRSDPAFVAGWAYRVPIAEIAVWIDRLAPDKNQTGLEILFARWAESDPAAAMEAALALPPIKGAYLRKFDDDGWASRIRVPGMSEPPSPFLIRIARVWIKADPDAAMSAILALPETSEQRRHLLDYTLTDIARKRPADAVRIAFEELGPRGKFEIGGGWSGRQRVLVASLFYAWGERDPRAAMARAMAIDERSLREAASESAFRSWSASDPEAAQQWFDSLPPADQISALRGAMLFGLVSTDPLRALVLSFENEPGNDGDCREIVSEWALRDAEGMIRAVGEVVVPELRSLMVSKGFWRLAYTRSGEEMAALAMALPAADAQQSAMTAIAPLWAEQDAPAAERWGLELEDPILRRQFLREFYAWQSPRAPAEAAAGVARIPDAKLRGVVAADVASAWSRENPALAAEWLASAAGTIAPDALAHEIIALPANIRRVAPPDALAHAHAIIASQWTRRSPGDALAWFSTLSDEAIREAVAREIAYRLEDLHEENGTDGTALIEAAESLSADDRAMLLERLSPED